MNIEATENAVVLCLFLFILGFQNGGHGLSGCLFSYFECCLLLVTVVAACMMRTVSLLGSKEVESVSVV